MKWHQGTHLELCVALLWNCPCLSMVVENGGPTREAHSICSTGGKQLDDCMSLSLSVLCQNVHLLQVAGIAGLILVFRIRNQWLGARVSKLLQAVPAESKSWQIGPRGELGVIDSSWLKVKSMPLAGSAGDKSNCA